MLFRSAEDNHVVITGTGEAGSTVTVTLDDGVNTPFTTTVVVNGSGNWQTSDIDISGFADVLVSVSAFATDVAGNAGAPATHPGILHDSSAPAQLSINVVEGDDVVNAAEEGSVVISGSGAEAGATVQVTISDGVNTDIVVAATIGAGGTWSTAGTDISSLNEGSLTVTAVQTDGAGNPSTPATRPITHDSAAPNGLALTAPITADNIVNSAEDDTLVVFGTGAEPSSTVQLRFSDGMNLDVLVTATVDGSGAITGAPADISSLNDGNIVVTAVETDSAGNVGAPVSLTFTHDTSGPTGITIDAPDPLLDATEEIGRASCRERV